METTHNFFQARCPKTTFLFCVKHPLPKSPPYKMKKHLILPKLGTIVPITEMNRMSRNTFRT